MRSEDEMREVREAAVRRLKEAESRSTEWHRLEAVEVTLDYILEENRILEVVIPEIGDCDG